MGIGIETLAAAVILLPIMLIENKLLFKNNKRTIYYIVFAVYLSSVFAAVGIPSIYYFRLDLTVNVIPFIPMINDFQNSVLNVILFIPLGIGLAYLWGKFASLKRVVLTGFGMSLIIELLQIFTYRTTDINDLITNTLGAACGYMIVIYILKKQRLAVVNENNQHFYIVSVTAFATMFFVQPLMSSILWSLAL